MLYCAGPFPDGLARPSSTFRRTLTYLDISDNNLRYVFLLSRVRQGPYKPCGAHPSFQKPVVHLSSMLSIEPLCNGLLSVFFSTVRAKAW